MLLEIYRKERLYWQLAVIHHLKYKGSPYGQESRDVHNTN